MSVDAPEPLLELVGIHAGYGGIEVIHGVDLTVPTGSVMALLGPNGAGKSTTLHVAAGFHAPSAGDVILGGRRVNGAAPDAIARAGLCLVPEGKGIFPNLTVGENLLMATHTGQSRSQVESIAYQRFPRLSERRNQPAGTMSGGEQQMLAMARALTSEPALLILDELSMGLAPIIVEELYELVDDISAGGVSILLVEQFATAALAVADRAAIMVHGRIRSVGTPDEIQSELSDAYLGG